MYKQISSDNMNAVVHSFSKANLDKLETSARVITRKRDAVSALNDSNIAALDEALQSVFNRLAASGDIDALSVYNMDGKNMSQFYVGDADTVIPQLALNVIASGKRENGYMKIGDQNVGYGLAFPILKGRSPIGVGVLAVDLENTIIKLSEAIGSEIVITINGDVKTATENAPNLNYSDLIFNGYSLDMKTDTGHSLVAETYINDPNGLTIAKILTSKNITEKISSNQNFNLMLMTAVILLVVSFVAIMVFWLRKQFAPLTIITNLIGALANGEKVEPISEPLRNDEIGKLSQSLSSFQQVLNEQEIQAGIEKKRADESRLLQSNIGLVVSSIEIGELTNRLSDDFEDADCQQVVRGINQMLTIFEGILNETRGVLSSLAHMDLTKRVNGNYQGTFAELKDDTNAVGDKLTEMIGQLQNTSTALTSATMEIQNSSESLSGRTLRQAASLEETSAALEEITSTIGISSERAFEVTKFAASAKEATIKSSEVVNDAVEAMARIEAASGEISAIINVIDEIAFQTNLLALNAGVEAARANEAGKGFAVVAQEVRELAQRSATAAKEIKALIDNSGREVSTGVKLVRDTGDALNEIAEQVAAINDHVSTMAQASKDQSAKLIEVNSAVGQMDQVTQQNAAMAEESSAVTFDLSSEADALGNLVSQFQVTEQKAREADPVNLDYDIENDVKIAV